MCRNLTPVSGRALLNCRPRPLGIHPRPVAYPGKSRTEVHASQACLPAGLRSQAQVWRVMAEAITDPGIRWQKHWIAQQAMIELYR